VRKLIGIVGLVAVVLSGLACGLETPGMADDDPATLGQDELFVDMAADSGLSFVHHNGMVGDFDFVEMMGPGGAFFDYDNDGDLDVYLLQGHRLGAHAREHVGKLQILDPDAQSDRLFRNDLEVQPDGTRVPRFTDVTESAGIDARGYGFGAATGDYDNDGWVDLYVTNWGFNQLWHNNGDGTFSDVTEATGTGHPGLGTSVSFADVNLDGWLDLYVANDVVYTAETEIECYAPSSARDYCGPTAYPAPTDVLYLNREGQRFEDVSTASGIGGEAGYGLGVVVADFNSDGWPDIYVANDRVENFLWVNQGDATFRNEAVVSGCAVNMDGRTEASMGLDVADIDHDGDDDLLMTHLDGESNTVYLNDGRGHFDDGTSRLGLTVPSLRFTSFGTAWLDFDNDSHLDIVVASGAVMVVQDLVDRGDPYPLHQQNQLFRNTGDGRFRDVTAEAGTVFELSEVTRGAVPGDVDNDGDMDILLTNNDGPVRLLVNQVGQDRAWLGLRLVDIWRRDALGARVMLKTGGGDVYWQRSHTDGGYCTARDPRVLFGLGDGALVDEVTVHWPDGSTDSWSDLAVGAYTTLVQGTGSVDVE